MIINIGIFSLFLILLPFQVFSQSQIENADFELIIKSSINVSILGEFKNSGYHISSYSPFMKMVRIRIHMKSNSQNTEIFDPNNLYLISNELKQRFRPTDLQYRVYLNSYIGSKRLTSDSILSDGTSKGWLGDVSYIRYDPKIRDTFKDYSVPGYQDLEFKANYGSVKKPQNVIVYFDHKEISSCVFDIYFVVPKTLIMGELYFGNKKIDQCSFDQNNFN